MLDLSKKFNVVNADCLVAFKELPDNCIDLIVTSPPYNLGIEYDSWNDQMAWDEYFAWCEKWLSEAFRVLKNDGRLCLNHYLSGGTAEKRVPFTIKLNEIAEKIGFKHHSVAIWTELSLARPTAWGSWLSASAPYIESPRETILFMYKNQWNKDHKGKSTISKREFILATSGIWDFQADRERLTPATFPLELPMRCIQLLTYEGEIVLDPFTGSGTTGKAAMLSNRKFVGFEISPKYFTIAKDRIESASKQTKFVNENSQQKLT